MTYIYVVFMDNDNTMRSVAVPVAYYKNRDDAVEHAGRLQEKYDTAYIRIETVVLLWNITL